MRNVGLTFALCLFALLAAGAALAAPVLDVDASSHGLAFSTDFAYGDAYLAVSGSEGIVHRAKVTDGAALQTAFGEGLGDGEYSWELLMVEPLSDEFRRELAAHRRGEKSSSAPTVASHAFGGSFRIVGGAVVEPRHHSQGDRDLATKDIVRNDDVIILFSLCVGNDCASGEVFSFDTVRLKENNLRMHFDDTSSNGSFPANDWRIIINDSTNGGSSHFSVEDATAGRAPFRIEAAAPANSLVVDSSGNLGRGTLDPVVEMHLVDGDTPTLRLEQNGSSGFGAQTWDVAGNETNFFIRDTTGGSDLPFRIFRDAPNDALTIAGDGDIGVNTANTPGRLSIRDTAGANSDMIYLENNGKITIRTANTGAGETWDFSNDGSFNISRVGSGTNEFRLNAAGSLTITGSLIAQGGDGSTDPGDTFPDYVFAPDYELMSIEDLEAFVASHRHLPNVPSASDISAAGGINMTELQLRLLEKVEELTLYTISQQKLLDAQRQLLREQSAGTSATIEAQAEAIRRLTERLEALEVD
ncbi:MAG: hypothetical protein AAGF23_24760 [Acidobacteriota bacterium]